MCLSQPSLWASMPLSTLSVGFYASLAPLSQPSRMKWQAVMGILPSSTPYLLSSYSATSIQTSPVCRCRDFVSKKLMFCVCWNKKWKIEPRCRERRFFIFSSKVVFIWSLLRELCDGIAIKLNLGQSCFFRPPSFSPSQPPSSSLVSIADALLLTYRRSCQTLLKDKFSCTLIEFRLLSDTKVNQTLVPAFISRYNILTKLVKSFHVSCEILYFTKVWTCLHGLGNFGNTPVLEGLSLVPLASTLID